MLFTLSFRNIVRHKGRLLINTLVVMVASCLLVMSLGQIGGTKKTLRESVTNTLTGHLIIKPTIAPVDFFQFTSSRKLPLIPSDAVQDLLTSLSSNNSFEGVSERLRFGSLIGDDDRSTGAMVLAVNPETEAQVCPDLADIVKPLATENYAILSQYLINKTKLNPKDSIVVFSETPINAFNAWEYTIGDPLETPVLIDEFTNQLFVVSLASAQDLLYLNGEASEIVIRVKEQFRDKAALEELRNTLNTQLQQNYPNLSAYTYYEVETSIENMSVIAEGMGVIQVGTIILVMLVTTLILTSITLYERRFEIGALMSIGMTPSRLTQMFLLEVFLKVSFGFLLGMSLGIFMVNGIIQDGGIKAQTAIDQYIYGGKITYPIVDFENIFLGGGLMIAVALCVTFVTCYKAGRQNLVTLLSTQK